MRRFAILLIIFLIPFSTFMDTRGGSVPIQNNRGFVSASLTATFMDISGENITISDLNFTDDILGIRISNSNNVTISSSILGNQSTSNLGLSIVNSANIIVQELTMDNYDVAIDFTGISIKDSENISISQVSMNPMPIGRDFVAVELDNVTNVQMSNIMVTGNETTTIGRDFKGLIGTTVTNLSISDMTLTTYNSSGNFIGISLDNAANVTLSQVKLEAISVDGDFSALTVNSVNNTAISGFDVLEKGGASISGDFDGLTMTDSSSLRIEQVNVQGIFANSIDMFSLNGITDSSFNGITMTTIWHQGSGIRLFDIQASQNLNLSMISATDLGTNVRLIDPAGLADTYGFTVNLTSNLNLKDISIINADLDPYGFRGIIADGSNGLYLQDVLLQEIVAGVVEGMSFDTVTNLVLNGTLVNGVVGTGVEILSISSSTGQIGILNSTIQQVESTAKGNMVVIRNTQNADISDLELKGISTSSTIHPLVGLLLDKANQTTVDQGLLQSFSSSIIHIIGIWVNASSNVIINNTELTSFTSASSYSIGLLLTNAEDSSILNSRLSYVFGKSSSVSISSVSTTDSNDPLGYGFFLEDSSNIMLVANAVFETDVWMTKDEQSTVTLINNTVNGNISALVSLSGPADVTVDITDDPIILEWIAITNPSNQSKSYTLYINGVKVANGTWVSGTPIQYSTANLSIGTHILEMVFTEYNGLNTSDIVIVTVTELVPPVFVATQSSRTVALGASYSLMWNATDTNPDSFSLIRNGTEVLFGSWQSGVPIYYDLSTTQLGIWNFTMIFRDDLGNEISSSAIIRIVEPVELKLVYGDIDITFNKGELAFISFEFQGFEGGNFTVAIDGVPSIFGEWVNFKPNVVNVSDFSLGQHKVAIIGIDNLFQTISFEVIVLVLPPVVTSNTNVDINDRLAGILDQPAVSNNLPIFLTIVGLFLATGVTIQILLRKGKLPRLQNFLSKRLAKKKKVEPKKPAKKSTKKTSKKSTKKK
ncbi:MAG: hypothetical protein D6732_08630 [Methanobacteriota archaeon]|nr:MAG: hypothetical protein D6732_08630 [Euryarchaeota archaeon]